MPDYVSNPADLPRGTLPRLFLDAVEEYGDAVAYRFHDGSGWREVTVPEVYRRVRALSAVLCSWGLKRGDRIAILSENRPEWAVADYACQCAGLLSVPVYPSLPPGQIEYLLADSEARLVFVSTATQLSKVEEIRSRLSSLERVVVFERGASGGADASELPAVLGEERATGSGGGGSPSDAGFREEALRARPDDVATVLYTSGTTGQPKGVMLTHDNLYSNVEACSRVLDLYPGEVELSFLPLSHVFQRLIDYFAFRRGVVVAYARSLETVVEDIAQVNPTFVASVPRLYEKFYQAAMSAGGVKQLVVRWARDVGDEWADEKLAGREPRGILALRYAVADRLVFRKLRAATGTGLRFFISGGGPLPPAINKFLYSAGITVLEGYGLTETSPVTNVNTIEDFTVGTVGRPVPGTEEKIAPDGEILVRGPQVMKGYYKRPEETREAIDGEGWFHTGDVGEIDDGGHLRITDRKKDILVTSGGKNIAPQPIEGRVAGSPFVEQAVMVGDGRRFPALLVVPDFQVLERWAGGERVFFSTRRELLEDPRTQAHMERQILDQLTELARFEEPKKIALLSRAFTIDDGSLTPTQKVKRQVVEKRHRELIESFYDERHRDLSIFLE